MSQQNVFATAIPVQKVDNPPNDPSSPNIVGQHQHTGNYAQQPAQAYSVYATPVQYGAEPFNENAQTGICRKCRRVFQRPAGVNDGQVQYYRCAECEQDRLTDTIMGSCIVS